MSVSFLFFSLKFLHKSKLTEIYANPRKPMKLLKFTQSTGKRVYRSEMDSRVYLWTLFLLRLTAVKLTCGLFLTHYLYKRRR